MKTQEIVDVRVGESTQPDYGYELSDRCIISGLKVLQRAAHGFIRQNRLNAGTDDLIRIPPQCGIHNTVLLTEFAHLRSE